MPSDYTPEQIEALRIILEYESLLGCSDLSAFWSGISAAALGFIFAKFL
jgi:hypothetical protein